MTDRRPPRWARELTIVGFGALAIAIVLTWPLATHLGTDAHHSLDPPFQAWTVDWVQHKIFSPGHLFDANIYAPEQTTLAYSDSLIGIAVPLLPLRWLGVGPMAMVNIALLLGFALSALGAYVFGRIVTGSMVVGAVVGIAYAFGPFGTLHAGHLQVTMRPGPPLAAAAVWVLADRARDGKKLWPVATALAAVIAWQASVSFQPAVMTLAAAAVVLAVRWRSFGRRGFVAVACGLGAAIAAVGVLAIPYLVVHGRYPDFDRPLSVVSFYGADFGSTDPRLSIWGPVLGRGTGWPAFAGSAFPGAVLLVLAPIGLVTSLRRASRMRLPAFTGVGLVVVGALLALGTSDHGWREYSPYRILYEIVPGISGMRATGRAWAIGVLGLGLLAGIGVLWLGSWIAARAPRVAYATVAVAAIAAVAILAEGYAPWTGLAEVRIAPVDEALARLPGDDGVLYLPVNATGTSELDLSLYAQVPFVYGSTAHHRPMPNGYSGYVPKSYAQTSKVALDLPGQQAITYLRKIGVRYVVVTKGVEGGPWEDLRRMSAAKPLRLLGRYGGDLLYEIPRTGKVPR